ncbi:SDR family oxidoreductase [Sediminitomix flava]|uniref:NAD(P)-dependent dehydrogenase (Short-subunit alcohol dehydrogenase family) n=1 Tax=Sediminitomix flava TaxID=379075 RepID=A0A315ZC94_SEDFL|nr:SDR family oxidoreductase [Sediminitomix flava]PWJ43196.1 NAD(P)-dependent dehydrogenase (short-subunit alcohol dehydrogenase family) [Sediminitomix flava]
MKRIALVTGANKGLGFETARQLGEKGIKVLMASRNKERGQHAVEKLKAEGLDVELVQLEATNDADIEALKQYIESAYGKLDILVNNAGIMHNDEPLGVNTSESISAETLQHTFDVNFFSVVRLTQALLPLLKKSEAGRIINLSSILGSNTVQSDTSSPYYGVKPFAYNASKAALNSFTVHLAASLEGTSIKVNSAHPGWVKTDLGTEGAPMEVVDGAKTSVSLSLSEETDFSGKFIHMGEEVAW